MYDVMPGGEEMVTEPVEVTTVCGCCWNKLDTSLNNLKCPNCMAEYPGQIA